MGFCGATLPDPFVPGEVLYANAIWGSNRGYSDISAKTVRATPIDTGVRNLVLIVAGQSNRTSVAPSAYTPTNPTKLDNLNLYDGQIYAAADPMLGCSYIAGGFGTPVIGCVALRVADLFVTNGIFDRVIIVPIAVAATQVAHWDTGGALANRIPAAIKRCIAKGIVPGMTNVTFAIEWGQGEGDYATNQADYQAALNRVIANSQLAGFIGRWFVAKQSYTNGTTFAQVVAAQTAVLNGSTVFTSANADLLVGANRAIYGTDDTHFSDLGNANLATAIYDAMHASGSPY